ncbi:ABC transporter ATP-binding protein [Lactobacillus xylocopicola]|uniref:ABC transporter ATP-binding protein n=1 Tax=Lactobacillus xylocopicola TaxID=2976676 RepID=A0ABM8BFB3_9LACO|nr:ABC transporter ATP-binding protein [Lactobacillus xylocopicola]BDR59908.1 ABC transporter ATP-binding protein [Lactobacillus xylocopicola]
MEHLLQVEHVVRKFGGLTAVNDVSLHLDQHELVALIGPNGAGKTTLFNLLTGMIPVTSGKIDLTTEQSRYDLTRKSPVQIAELGLSRTFQNIRLFKSLTVMDNVLAAMTNQYKENFVTTIMRLPGFYRTEEEMRVAAKQLLDLFDLTNYATTPADKLPYGTQRRLEIVRALATHPQILFLDEPAAGMNPEETADLTNLIKHVQEEFQITVLLIEHDMSLVMNLAERIYVLDQGQILTAGPPEEVKSNPKVIEAYLGEGED